MTTDPAENLRQPPTGLGPAMLEGVRVVEFAGLGPAPFCGMLLSDMGATVVRIQRPGEVPWLELDLCARNREILEVDLRHAAGRERCLALIAGADVLIEGFRPGVMERLGLGPGEAMKRNPRLVYGRMTGWGQHGPRARTAGHDINYIGLTGALHAMGDPDRPPHPPINLLGDYGGGALYLAMGIATALFRRERSGEGCVIDAAMVDGVSSLLTPFAGILHLDRAALDRGTFELAGAAPNYRCYRCADGGFVAAGALEPQFHQALLDLVGNPYTLAEFADRASWPELCERMAQVFARHARDHWARLAENTDTCLTPVLSMNEAMADPHLAARGTYREVDGVRQPRPAPRFEAAPG